MQMMRSRACGLAGVWLHCWWMSGWALQQQLKVAVQAKRGIHCLA